MPSGGGRERERCPVAARSELVRFDRWGSFVACLSPNYGAHTRGHYLAPRSTKVAARRTYVAAVVVDAAVRAFLARGNWRRRQSGSGQRKNR